MLVDVFVVVVEDYFCIKEMWTQLFAVRNRWGLFQERLGCDGEGEGDGICEFEEVEEEEGSGEVRSVFFLMYVGR